MQSLTDETREKLKALSKSLLSLHKSLLDHETSEYEYSNGKVNSPNELFRLVLDHQHFAWLRMLSGQIVLIDEFLASKTPITEFEGQDLIKQTKMLLDFEDNTKNFADRLHIALQKNKDSVTKYNQTLLNLK